VGGVSVMDGQREREGEGERVTGRVWLGEMGGMSVNERVNWKHR
jgi:hypothetical protein